MAPDAERRPGGRGGAPDDTATIARGGRHWRGQCPVAVAEVVAASAARRARVLAHGDLAVMLTLPPLSYGEPGQWSGYVPPRLWRDAPNDSPRRAALVAICAEAMRREAGEPGAAPQGEAS